MTKIHFLSDSLKMNSGFGNVIKNLMFQLRNKGYICTMTGLQTSFIKEWNFGFECFPLIMKDISEEVQYTTTLLTVKPDIVFNLFGSDTGNMDNLLAIPLNVGIKKRIFYPPVDGKGLGMNSISTLKSFTENGGKIISQCNWGADQIRETGIDVAGTIYHGYNENIFKKLDLKKNNKYCWYNTDIGRMEGNPEILQDNYCRDCGGIENESKYCNFIEEQVGILKYNSKPHTSEYNKGYEYIYYPINSIKDLVKGKYVFGFTGANFGVRKRIERLINSYSILIKDNKQLSDRTILWLHTFPISMTGINLLSIVKKLGIEKNVIFSYGSDKASGWSEQGLNILYNLFDCHVTATSAEGFGLSTLESMACGVPQIATNICSFPELIGQHNERGYLVDNDLQMIQDGSYRALINEEDLKTKMRQMYENGKLGNVLSHNTMLFAKDYTWSKVTDEWIKIFDKL